MKRKDYAPGDFWGKPWVVRDYHETPIVPSVTWGQPQDEWPPVKEGYIRLVVGREEAKLQAWLWGVEPRHVGRCTYVIDIPFGTFNPDGPAAKDAEKWLEGVSKEAAAQFVKYYERYYGLGHLSRREAESVLSWVSTRPLPEAVGDRRKNLELFAFIVYSILKGKNG